MDIGTSLPGGVSSLRGFEVESVIRVSTERLTLAVGERFRLGTPDRPTRRAQRGDEKLESEHPTDWDEPYLGLADSTSGTHFARHPWAFWTIAAWAVGRLLKLSRPDPRS